ncbi:MAG: acyloxyacyl hydrolase [Bacteroidales bacterium]|nr:acyloxyacyl hydrolase [Bacteroidales bacterium]MBN2757606.1 acyloxyacyl hydrolase [Bacteroidales bacterium]
MHKKITLIIFISFFTIYKIFSQDTEHNNLFIESKYQYGFIWQHRPSLAEIIGGNINVFDFSVAKQTYGEKDWQQLFHYPAFGFGYYFVDLGNPQELGQANALFAFYDIPIFRKQNSALSYKLSGGLAYLNKGNIAIGSHINLFFDLSFIYKLKLSKNIDLVTGFGATHFSNGAVKMPNLGVNLFSYKLGLQYRFNQKPIEYIKHELPQIDKKNIFSVLTSAGVKEKRPDGGKKYDVKSTSIEYLRRINHKYNIGLGADVFYDESLYDVLNPDSTKIITQSEVIRYGIHASFEASMNKLVFTIQAGTYIFTYYTDDGIIYQRVGLKYFITKNILANITLKTSKGVADFVEWGLVYRFYWKT